MVGFINIKVHGQQQGDQITLRFAELLTPDSLLYTANLRGAENTDRYVIARRNDEAILWHPSFVYHGFRYVEISGLRETTNSDDFEG